DAEDQVPAVLDLVDRVRVAEAAAALLVEVEGEAQTRGVDPPLADLAQSRYSRLLRQGICDPGQAGRVGNGGAAVAVPAQRSPRPVTSPLARSSPAMRCWRSPALQKRTGTPSAAPQALTRRASRPAIRIRCALSSVSSLSSCRRRHHTRNPPGLCPSE